MAWDVDRLVELSRNLPSFRVPIGSIDEMDQVYWFDGELELPTCRNVMQHVRLILQVDTSHPIILGADGRVMDGMHRVAKAYLDGVKEIDAVQFEIDPDPDYIGRRPSELPY
jgi:hypothetical protein